MAGTVDIGNLQARLTMDTSGFDKGLSGAQTELKGLGGKIQANSASLKKIGAGATIAGGAVVGAFGLATKSSVDFEKSMSEVFTLLPNMSSDAKKKMSEDLREFNTEMGITSEDSIPALYQAISAGVPPDNVFEFLKTANQAAVGGVTDLETAVDGITSVTNAYGSDIVSAAKASDLMFTAVKLGKTNFEELSGSLYNVIPIASSLGVGFEDVTASIAAMTAQGTPTAQATTQIKAVLNELSNSSSATAKTFQELSGQTFAEFIASGGDMQGAFELMKTGADDSGVALADLFSSVEAKGAVMTLTGEAGAKAFATALDEMEASSGATEKAFDTMDDSASRSIDKLMAMFEEIKLEVGDVFLPILKDQILPIIKTILDKFEGMPDWMKPVIVAIGGISAALVILGPLLMALPALVTAIGAAFTILSANPIILVIGGLILLLIWLQSEFDILGIAIDALQKGMEIASDLFSGAIEVMGDVAEFVIGAIVGYFTNLWKNIQTIIEYITKAFDVFMGVVETVGDFIESVFDTVVGTVKGAINWIIDGINTMIRGLNMLSFDVPDWIPGIGGASFGFNLNTIPRLAEGGIVTEPTIAMIGEAGPEAVVPLSGGSAAGGININVENMNVRDDKDIKLIADELYTLIDRKNRARGVV